MLKMSNSTETVTINIPNATPRIITLTKDHSHYVLSDGQSAT